MEPIFALAFGVMIAVSAYLILSRNVLRILLGLLVLGNAANLAIFLAGRLSSRVPPLIAPGETTVAVSANPLPQALILTAIVISFSLVAFTAVLFENAHKRIGTLDPDAMRDAETPAGDGLRGDDEGQA
ncbi:NADH-quinone oxidoreductase subunit K [Hyphomicrobium sp.]|uniref:NADH-quinone oxidoreductase subunit K n=1 Tax=Hyphomicrobium sp. TaxID=82 RepID=UPI002C6FEF19|nr:NADH-quinone oxidoreductase subunit K [Hyphomicrobium sp.]HRN89438.1 NADH-quinone oxidoreductase subunit K [Hyphomicrobium sp.]HRQ27856.1 NADH-quinone oxidoreductase subunit K [Hyphomicrobium sp.]